MLDTAGAEIGFFVCTVDETEGIGAIGSARGRTIERYCTSLVAAEGAEMQLNASPRQQVVMSIATSRPGRVKVAAMDLNYSLGWRTGTQRVGGTVELRSRG